MGRWTAVSDYDFDDERWPRRRPPRCDGCGSFMTVRYDDYDRPLFAACRRCNKESHHADPCSKHTPRR